jgi:hypothetical protein
MSARLAVLGLMLLLVRPAVAGESGGNAWDRSGALEAAGLVRKAARASYFVSLRTGWLLYLITDYAAAEKSYRDAVAAKPGAIEARMGLSLVLYVEQKWKELETTCKQVLADDAKNATVRARMAAGYYGAGNYADATGEFGALHVLGETRIVGNLVGRLDLSTGNALVEDDGFEACARRVNGCGQTGRAGSHNDDIKAFGHDVTRAALRRRPSARCA